MGAADRRARERVPGDRRARAARRRARARRGVRGARGERDAPRPRRARGLRADVRAGSGAQWLAVHPARGVGCRGRRRARGGRERPPAPRGGGRGPPRAAPPPPPAPPGGLLAAAASLLAAHRLLRGAGSAALPEEPAVPRWDLPLRLALTALLAVCLTAAASRLGPVVGGTLAALPVLASILAVFTHARYGAAAVTELLRGMLGGMAGFVAFCALVAALAEPAGIGAAFAVATVAALAVQAAAALERRQPACGAFFGAQYVGSPPSGTLPTAPNFTPRLRARRW